ASVPAERRALPPHALSAAPAGVRRLSRSCRPAAAAGQSPRRRRRGHAAPRLRGDARAPGRFSAPPPGLPAPDHAHGGGSRVGAPRALSTEHEQRRWEALADGLEGRLLALLESRTGARGLTYAAPPVRLGGGRRAQLHGFRLARAPAGLEGELVLRAMPTSDPQAAREAAIQQAVHAAGFPVPEVRLQGGRQAGLGFPFIIMTRVAG